jgi:hypothetical protein
MISKELQDIDCERNANFDKFKLFSRCSCNSDIRSNLKT